VVQNRKKIHVLYGFLRLTRENRNEYFALSAQRNATLHQLHLPKFRVFFLLQLDYFQSRQLLFDFDLLDVAEDASHVGQKYLLAFDHAEPTSTEGTRFKQNRRIHELCKYWNTDVTIRRTLEAHARQAQAAFCKPMYVDRDLMHLLAEDRVGPPGYSHLIANCIISYSASTLSQLLEHKERTGDIHREETTKKIAPITWQKINLQDRFEIHESLDALNVAAIIHTLTRPSGTHAVTMRA
jgi:hypothetical protein